MADVKKKKTRMYEPWGYQDENNYQSTEIIVENDLDSFFVGTEYNKDDGFIYFTNKDGEEVGKLDTAEFVKDDKIVERAYYDHDTQSIIIEFTNGDRITIPVGDILDENEFEDGLMIDDHVVKVLVDSESERWLTVSINGVKVSGIQAEIDRLDERIDDEIARAISAETDLQAAINAESQRAQDAEAALDEKIEQEEDRAKTRENEIEAALNAEKTRATQTEGQLNHRIDVTNDELGSEESRAQAAEQELRNLITDEANNRIAGIRAEESRAKAKEAELEASKFDDVDYDSATKLINFYADGDVIKTLDATPFVVSGLIKRVYVDTDTQELVIVWYTETGEDEMRIPLSDIFNPNDYYTKDEVDNKIDGLESGVTSIIDNLIEKLGYTNNETLVTTNEHEVAFGEWNVSNTSSQPSEQTIFSIGNGTSNANRSNAVEVRKDGSVYLLIEGEMMNINELLGQLAHEVYDG